MLVGIRIFVGRTADCTPSEARKMQEIGCGESASVDRGIWPFAESTATISNRYVKVGERATHIRA